MQVNQVSWNDLLAKRALPVDVAPRGLPWRSRPKAELTPRREQATKLLADGLPLKDIEFAMGLKPGVVKIYLDAIYNRLGLPRNRNRRVLLVRWWIEHREMVSKNEQLV